MPPGTCVDHQWFTGAVVLTPRMAPSGLNGVDSGLRRGHGPQPITPAGDLPAGFVGRDDGAAAELLLQSHISRLRLAGSPVDGVHQAASTDGQAVVLPQERGNLAERQTRGALRALQGGSVTGEWSLRRASITATPCWPPLQVLRSSLRGPHRAARGETPASHRDGRGARLTRRDEGAYWPYSTPLRNGPAPSLGRDASPVECSGAFCHGLRGQPQAGLAGPVPASGSPCLDPASRKEQMRASGG